MILIRNGGLAIFGLVLFFSSAVCYSTDSNRKVVDLAISFGVHAESLRKATLFLMDEDKRAVQDAAKPNLSELDFSFGIQQELISLRKATESMNRALLIASFSPPANADAVTRHLTAMCGALALNALPGFSPFTQAKLWTDAANSEYPRLIRSARRAAEVYVAAAETAAGNCSIISVGRWDK